MDRDEMISEVHTKLSEYVRSRDDIEYVNRILEAMKVVDRKFFVMTEEEAYYDTALRIAEEQTISQPSTVGRMLLLARLREGENVLEVGTGSGWSAALTAYLVDPGKVKTLERFSRLLEMARSNINEFRSYFNHDFLDNIELSSDELLNHESHPKVDKIIITAGIVQGQEDKLRDLVSRLLNEGGKLICPYTLGPMIIMTKIEREIEVEYTSDYFGFVPLIL